MNTAEHVLLIILSGALAVLLVFAIAATVLIVKLVNSLRRIAQKAEGIVQSAESVTTALKGAVTPIGVFNFVKSVISMTQKAKKGK